MDKKVFIEELSNRLSDYPDKGESLIEKYSLLIDEYMNKGASEEEAVFKLGSIDNILLHEEDERKSNSKAVYALLITMLVLISPILLGVAIFIAILFVVFYALLISCIIGTIALGLIGLGIAIFGITKFSADGAAAVLGSGLGLFVCGGMVIIFPVILKCVIWVWKEASSFIKRAVYTFIGGVKNVLL